MKKFLLVVAVALGLGATVVSCNGKADQKAGSSLDDSISMTFGEMYGYGIAGEAMHGPDSAKFNKEDFLKGLTAALKVDTAKTSYIQGMQMGMQLQQMVKQLEETQGVKMDVKKFLASFKEAFNSKETKDPNSFQTKLMDLMQRAKAEAAENDPVAKKNKEEGAAFLAKTEKEEGVKKLPNGVLYKVVKEGNGNKFNASDRIMVKYEGKHINGEMFDNGQGQAVPMSPQGVIKGMSDALLMMSPGAHYILYIPAEQAYGAEGTPGGPIKPNETLIFDVETIEVAQAPTQGK